MRTSAASRRSSRRPLVATVVLALALVGLAPGAALAGGELVGGATRAEAVPVDLGPLGGSFRASNIGINTPGDPVSSYVDNAWYSYTPSFSGALTLRAVADASNFDITIQARSADGTLLDRNDAYGALTTAQIDNLMVTGGTTYLVAMGGYDWTSSWVTNGSATMTLTLAPTPPTPPLNVTAAEGDASAVVAWEVPTDTNGPVTEYTVWCTPDGGAEVACGGSSSVDGAAAETTATITGLTNGTAYSVRVTATSAAGTSDFSAPASVTPRAVSSVVITTDPASPVSGDVLHLTWAVDVHGSPPDGIVDVTVGGATTPGLPVVSTMDVPLSAGPLQITVAYPGTASIAPSSASVTVSVAKRAQTVTFTVLPDGLVFAGPTVTLVASSSEVGLPVTFSASGGCTATGDQLTFTGVGGCTVVASQAGTTEVLPASATQVVQVAKRSQALSVTGLPPVIGGNGQFAVSSVSDVGLPVTLTASGACTISGGVVTIVDVGECMVTGTQAGDEHTLAGNVTATALVSAEPAAASLRIGFAVGDPVEGSPVTVTGSGLRPGTPLTITVYSTVTQVGSSAASVLGAGLSVGQLPALEAGEHRVVARGTALDGTRVSTVVRFAVDADGVVTRIGRPADLANSGTDAATGSLALLWLVAGAGLLALRRTLVLRHRTT